MRELSGVVSAKELRADASSLECRLHDCMIRQVGRLNDLALSKVGILLKDLFQCEIWVSLSGLDKVVWLCPIVNLAAVGVTQVLQNSCRM